MPNLLQKLYVHEKILSCLNRNLHKKNWIFKQSAAPTLATLACAANGRPLAACGLAGINAMGFLTSPANQSKLNGPYDVLLYL